MTNKVLANKTKQEKAAMVKDLLSGKASLKDHRPHKVFVWEHISEYYTSEDGSLQLTEDEFSAHCRDLESRYNTSHIIVEDYSISDKTATA